MLGTAPNLPDEPQEGCTWGQGDSQLELLGTSYGWPVGRLARFGGIPVDWLVGMGLSLVVGYLALGQVGQEYRGPGVGRDH